MNFPHCEVTWKIYIMSFMMIAVGKGVFKYIGYELNCFKDIISYTYVGNNWWLIGIISIVSLKDIRHRYDVYLILL